MVLMGVVEMVRKYELRVHGGIDQLVAGVHYNASRVRLYWQTPQFLLVGVAESFTLVSGLGIKYAVKKEIKTCDVFEIFIDRVAGEIIRLVASVCVSVRLSVGTLLFELFDL